MTENEGAAMEFVRAFGDYVDNVWSLLTLPSLLIAGFLLIGFLPIPTALILGFFIYACLRDAYECAQCYDDKPTREMAKRCRSNLGTGVVILLSSFIAYGVFIYFTLADHYEMCKDMSDYIPGTLSGILQKLVPHSC